MCLTFLPVILIIFMIFFGYYTTLLDPTQDFIHTRKTLYAPATSINFHCNIKCGKNFLGLFD